MLRVLRKLDNFRGEARPDCLGASQAIRPRFH
jgi:hypothetical protein